MRRIFIFLLMIGLISPLSSAQEDAPLREIYEAYADENRIGTEFYDRLIDQEVTEEEAPEPEERVRDEPSGFTINRGVTTVLIIFLLAGLIVLLVQNAGQLNVDRQERVRRTQAERKRRQTLAPDEIAARQASFAERPDKIAAVEDMLAEAFEKAERDLDTIFGEADTARELERRLRGAWRFHDALHQLVRASEQSQFAGVPLAQDQYQACVQAYGKIMEGKA